ncbi:MAG: hypothetical protein ACREM2_03835 [Vulcanimicrobiaceae bacterium]
MTAFALRPGDAYASPPASRPERTPSASPNAAVVASASAGEAFARSARRFDPQLSDAQVAAIAKEIEGNRKSGARLAHGKPALVNADEPVTRFRVEPW